MFVAQTIVPIFLLILLGVAMRRWFGLREDFWPQLDRLIYYVFFPALLFNSLSHFKIDLGSATPMLIVAMLYMLAGIALGYAAKFLFHAPSKVFAATFQSSFRFNSYVGLAIAGGLHGHEGLAAIGLLMGFMVPVANVASVLMLARHSESHWLKEILLNPLIISTAGGITFSLAGLELPTIVQHHAGFVVASLAADGPDRRRCRFAPARLAQSARHAMVWRGGQTAVASRYRMGSWLWRSD